MANSATSRACPPSPPPRRSWPRCGRAGATRSTARTGCRAWSGSPSRGSGKLPVSEVTSADVVGVAGRLERAAGNGTAGVAAHVDHARALMRAEGVLPFVSARPAVRGTPHRRGASCSPAPPASERTPAQDAAGRDRTPRSCVSPGTEARTASRGDAFGGTSSVAAFGTDVRATMGSAVDAIYHAAVAAPPLTEVQIGTRPRRPAAGRRRRRAARRPR